MLNDMSTSSRFKMIIKRLLVVFVTCLTLFIAASSMGQAAGASITFSRSSSSFTMQVEVDGKGFFSVREMISIGVAFPGDPLNRRFHDWLPPATYWGEA